VTLASFSTPVRQEDPKSSSGESGRQQSLRAGRHARRLMGVDHA